MQTDDQGAAMVPVNDRQGFLTQPTQRGLSPAIQAAAQRAKSEIEASLTIAAARPRDEKEALDQIIVSCQRPGVAEEAEYEYSKGGTSIVGPTIRLLELIAQKWGNMTWGFRETARYPAANGQPGSSVIEAYAWDMQSNSRRTVEFVANHEIKAHGKMKPLTDEREIYELWRNVAQRRVRTSLENVIPRDIVDSAVAQCRETLKTREAITPEKIANLVKAFAEFKVTKDQLEKRLQRRIDSITPAQMVQLRRIFTSLRDGVGQVDDWFEVESKEPPKSAAEQAKEKMRKQQASPPAATETTAPASHPREPGDDEPAAIVQQPPQAEQDAARAQLDAEECLSAWGDQIAACEDLTACNKLEQESLPSAPQNLRSKILEMILARRTEIRGKRGNKRS